MKCDDVLEKILLVSQGILSKEEEQLVKSHYATCSTCKEELDEINQLAVNVNKSRLTPSPEFEKRLNNKLEKKNNIIPFFVSAAAAIILSVVLYSVIVRSPISESEKRVDLGSVIKRHVKSMELFAKQAKNLKTKDREKDITLLKGELDCSGLEQTEKILCKYEPDLKSFSLGLPGFVRDSSHVIRRARDAVSKKTKEALDEMKAVIKQSKIVERSKDLAPQFDKFEIYKTSCDINETLPEIEKFLSARKCLYDQDIKSAKKEFTDYKAQFSFAPYIEYANFCLGSLSLIEGDLSEAMEFYFHVEDEEMLENEEDVIKQAIMKKMGKDAKMIEGKFVMKSGTNAMPMQLLEKLSLKFDLDDFIFLNPEPTVGDVIIQVSKTCTDISKIKDLAKEFPEILNIQDKKHNVVISMKVSAAVKDKSFIEKAKKLVKEIPWLTLVLGQNEFFFEIPEDEEGRNNQFFFDFGFGFRFEEED